MAGWHHWLNGCESEWTPGVGDGQGGLACCDSWGHKESDTTEWLRVTKSQTRLSDWTELNWTEPIKQFLLLNSHSYKSVISKQKSNFNLPDMSVFLTGSCLCFSWLHLGSAVWISLIIGVCVRGDSLSIFFFFKHFFFPYLSPYPSGNPIIYIALKSHFVSYIFYIVFFFFFAVSLVSSVLLKLTCISLFLPLLCLICYTVESWFQQFAGGELCFQISPTILG